MSRPILAAVWIVATLGCGVDETPGAPMDSPHSGAAESTPQPVAGLPTPRFGFSCLRQLVSGAAHTCALESDLTGWCWGANASRQVLDYKVDEVPTPVQLSVGGKIAQLAAGAAHTCALRTTGEVDCFGDDSFGQLGGGTVQLPVAADQISAGSYHTCAHLLDGSVWCWGRNKENQLGFASSDAFLEKPVELTGLGHHLVEVAAGGLFTCARTSGGAVACWGDNTHGSLGSGDFKAIVGPSLVSMPHPALRVYAGATHACALTSDHGLRCWGGNASGQLGDGSLADNPTATLSCGEATAVALGADHTCAVRTRGQLWCWGAGSMGQLGDGLVVPHVTPTEVWGGGGYVDVAAGQAHTCATKLDDTIWCFGATSLGRLASAMTQPIMPVPTHANLSCR